MNAHGRARVVLVIVVVLVLALAALLSMSSEGAGLLAALGVGTGPEPMLAEGATPEPSMPDAGPRRSEADAGPVGARPDRPLVHLAPATVRRDAASAGGISGTVVGHGSGRGVPDATLVFSHGGASSSVVTDASGAFLLAPEEPGTYVLAVASADGYLPYAPEWGASPIRFEVRPGAQVEGVTVTLIDAIDYVVEVVDGAGPVEGAEVIVHGAESGERALVPLAARHLTDAAGEVRLRAPDHAVIDARHDERGRGRGAIDSAAQLTHRLRILLSNEATALSGDRSISGLVSDHAGTGLAGATVTARHESEPGALDRELHPVLTATTDPEGHFTLTGLDAGSYMLHAAADGHGSARRAHVDAGADDVVIQLAEEASLVVRVIDAETGGPVASAVVMVERAISALGTEELALAAAYDAEGTIEVRGLPLGPARVIAAAPGYAESAPVNVSLSTGRTEATVSLARGGTIEGTITSSDGSPLEGARVSLEHRFGGGASAAPIERGSLTEPDGTFSLGGVSPGLRSIVVWASGHHGRIRSAILVAENATVSTGVVDLAPVEPGETPSLELAGIGAVLSVEGDVLQIGRVLDGGGAALAGLAAGDAILSIEGEPVAGLGFQGCIERIRGPEGTGVTLRVRRAAGDEAVLVVVRTRIRS